MKKALEEESALSLGLFKLFQVCTEVLKIVSRYRKEKADCPSGALLLKPEPWTLSTVL